MPQHVFTYGSLMFAPVWRRVVEGEHAQRRARLHGYGRRAVRGESYPAIVPIVGETVDGVLYLDVDEADLARLDVFEGADYARLTVRVQLVDVLPGGLQTKGLQPEGCHPVGLQPAGDAWTEAGVYVWGDVSRLEAGGWDPQGFERERMAGFIAGYCAERAPRR